MTANSTMDRPALGVVPSAAVLDVEAGLLAIQDAVNEMTGKCVPIEASTRMDEYFLEVVGEDDIEYLDLSFRLERRLGIHLSRDDWSFLTGGNCCHSHEEWVVKYAPMFTFGRLAELVAVRARLGRIRPITILGATSRAAGAFRQVEVIAKEIDSHIREFAPSTRVLDIFRGSRLLRLWGKVRAISANRIPPLPEKRTRRASDGLIQLAGWAILASAIGGGGYSLVALSGTIDSHGWFTWLLSAASYTTILVGLIALLSLGLVLLVRAPGAILEPDSLPNGIVTFRDLSLLIAGDRGGWCEKCSYDLTGLQSNRCPECGVDQRVAPIPPKWNAGPSAEVA